MKPSVSRSEDLTETQVPAAGRPVTRQRGRLWTLAAAVLVFSWILWTIGSFVFQRLNGEPLSPTCSLEVRRLDPRDHLPGPDVLLAAGDFQSFRGVAGRDGECRLILMFSAGGIERLRGLAGLPVDAELAVLVSGKVIATVSVSAVLSEQRLELVLAGVRAGDANEIFARLTE